MERNKLASSDITAGITLAVVMAMPTLYYSYSAIEIAAGRFTDSQGLAGIYATYVPEWLRTGPVLFGLGLPTVAAYLTWMFFHRLIGAWNWVAVILAIPPALVVGYPAFAWALFSSEEYQLAVISGVALLLCAAVAAFEHVAARRDRQEAASETISP